MLVAAAALLRTEVVVEVTPHRTVEVAVVDVLPAAVAAGMPRLRAVVGARAAEADPTIVVAGAMGTTKL